MSIATLQETLVARRGSEEAIQGVVRTELDWHLGTVAVLVQARRWTSALRLLQTFDVALPGGSHPAAGDIPSILGLPLPDSPALRALVPPLEISSGLSAFARLVAQLAVALELALPHHISLDPPEVRAVTGE